MYIYICIEISKHVGTARHRYIETCRDMSISDVFAENTEKTNPTKAVLFLVAILMLCGSFKF